MKLSDSQRNVLRYIGIRCASAAISLLIKSLRIKITGDENINGLVNDNKNFIAAFWHGSMMIGWYLHQNMNTAALVSRSKDGEVLARTLEKWNYNVVRGSSSIGGDEALKKMVELLRQNYSLAITPDGPRGPVYKMKAGAIVAAKKTGVPLFLIGIGIKNKFRLKSWDAFEIPKPFTKVVAVYSKPIFIDSSLNYDETNNKILECEEQLNRLQKEAYNQCQ